MLTIMIKIIILLEAENDSDTGSKLSKSNHSQKLILFTGYGLFL
jgi:hypothetical protein